MEVKPIPKFWRKALITSFVAGALLLLLAAIAWFAFPRTVIVSPPFSAQALEINALDYYDVGAVDLNRDGHLDLFTTNHSSRQSLLIADGRGGYTDALTRHGLDQVRDLPGLEDTGQPPDFTQPGLYIYFIQSTLYLRHIGETAPPVISGSIGIPGDPKVIHSDALDYSLDKVSGDDNFSRIVFSTNTDSEIQLDVTKSAPMIVTIERGVPLSSVFVGSLAVNPDKNDFELYLKDRHGIAWADVNGDSRVDAFMSRGALFGTLADLPGEMGDQFYVSDSSGNYVDSFATRGFEKRDCPARQVAWTDVNGDGLLDLYIACGRQVGGFWEYVPTAFRTSRDEAPNMLYVQTASGNFAERAAEYGLDFKVGGTFLWIDADLDGDADMLWASEKEVALYRNTSDGFRPETILPDSTTIQARQMSAADFDGDGDFDIFVAASAGSALLVNERKSFKAEKPNRLGLPSRVRTATWVDSNFDGKLDLYTWPGGLFEQNSSGSFHQSGKLRVPSPYWPLVDPRVLWFDRDNDGDRDLLVMQRFFPQAIQKMFPDAMPFTAHFLRNDAPARNNWLQLDLNGSADNPEAIGARATVITGNGPVSRTVGQSDSSHYSQGHYRLYFTFAEDADVERIEITWPDNSTQIIDRPETGRLIRVRKQSLPDAFE